MFDFEEFNRYTTYLAIFVIGLAFIELAYDLIKKKKRDLKEVAANTSIIIITRLIASLSTAVILYEILKFIQPYSLFKLNLNQTSQLIIAFLFADFCYYLSHFFSHKFRFLWAVHGVHHSSHEFNLFTAFRLNWLTPLIDIIFFAWPLLLFNIDVLIFSAMRILVLTLQFWIHNDKIKPIIWFDRLFNSPANHLIHHSVELKHRDKNFGGVFMVWDHLFGTYEKPDPNNKPSKFGVCVPVNSYNPFKIYFHEFIVWYKELKTK